MSGRPETLFVRPLFYDAISGEFTPPTDPLHGQHTLGRLAIASFIKGSRVTNTPGSEEYHYVPSWAENVDTWVDVLQDTPSFARHLTVLSLRNQQDESQILTIADTRYTRSSVDRGITITDTEGMQFLPLSLGEELAAARQLIAEKAQNFFDYLK
jgi:hypothetical protein